jgi:malonyl-CoA O-methyltransferase
MNDLDKQIIAANFSRAAPNYDKAAEAQRRMAEMVAGILPPVSVLPELDGTIVELGCGTGLLTEKLIEKYADTEIRAIDLAPGMIEYCRNKFGQHSGITFQVADAEQYIPITAAALVTSNCSFQWLHDQQQVLRRIHEYLLPGGFFALGAMLAGSLPELHESYAAAVGRSPASLPLWTESEYRKSIALSGFRVLPQSRVEAFRVEHRSAHEALRVLKEIGATLPPRAGELPLSPGVLRRLENHYRSRYTDPVTGRVRSTWRAFIILAEKF